MVFLGGILLIVTGMLSIFAKDLMWELTQYNNRMQGVASERTEIWDLWANIGGVLSIIIGVLTFFANG
jgi:uncharacterized membrane protein